MSKKSSKLIIRVKAFAYEYKVAGNDCDDPTVFDWNELEISDWEGPIVSPQGEIEIFSEGELIETLPYIFKEPIFSVDEIMEEDNKWNDGPYKSTCIFVNLYLDVGEEIEIEEQFDMNKLSYKSNNGNLYYDGSTIYPNLYGSYIEEKFILKEMIPLGLKFQPEKYMAMKSIEEVDEFIYSKENSETGKKEESEEIEGNDDNEFYEKVEPGGIAIIGKLNQEQIKLVESSKVKGKMNRKILDLKDNSHLYDGFRRCWGLFVEGKEGEEGYDGIIEFDNSGPLQIPINKETGKRIDGHYFMSLSLSKVSGGTKFHLSEGEDFDSNLFKQISVPIQFPECVYEGWFRYYEYFTEGRIQNIITSFKYKDQDLEYKEVKPSRIVDLIDRGYDHYITITKVEKGEPSLLYHYYKVDEMDGIKDPEEKWY